MKDFNSVRVNIAGKTINIKTNNSAGNRYIKSVLKNFSGDGNKPFFTIYVDTRIKQPVVKNWNINTIFCGSRFIFIHKRKNKPDMEVGFIDRKKRTAGLNIAPRNIRILFHPFLVSCLAYFLSEKDGFIVHAAGVIFKSNSYIFIGPSGSGKTTIAKILRKKGINIISDEKIVIRRKKGLFFAFGFPWGNDKNRRAPVKKIFFLKKSDKVSFNRLPYSKVIKKIFSQITLNIFDDKTAEDILDTLSLLFKKVPGYEMKFSKNDLFWNKLINPD